MVPYIGYGRHICISDRLQALGVGALLLGQGFSSAQDLLGLGFRVYCVGFRVRSLGFRGLRVWGLRV